MGIERLSFIALASIAGGPRSGLASPVRRGASRARAAVAVGRREDVGLGDLAAGAASPCTLLEVDSVRLRRRGGRPASRLASAAVRPAVRGRRRRAPPAASRCGGRCAAAGGAAPLVISARGWPTWTVSSGCTRILVIVPLGGRGDLGVDLVGGDLDHRLALLD